MPSPYIPLTRVKLKPYITLKTLSGGAFFEDPAAFAAAITSGTLNNKMITVGAVEKCVVNQDRTTNSVYRELNAEENSGTFGNPVESYPGLVNYSLELTRVVLHDKNLLEAFGFIGANLIEQKVPMLIQIIHPVPVDPNTGQAIVVAGKQLVSTVNTYYGCWFDKNSQEYGAEPGDLKVIQSCTMIATGMVSSKVEVS